MTSRILSALLWVAAFCFAAGVFLSLTLFFPSLPPTEPVAIGLITILRYAKIKDYLAIALFFLTVPPLTVIFEQYGRRVLPRRPVAAALFLTPYLFAPFFYLTTGKAGWILVLPIALSYLAPRALAFWQTHLWLRELFGRERYPYHALLFCEALSWILFRYLVLGRRIAHIPTLFLEVVFVAAFLALFWIVALFITRLVELQFGIRAFERVVTAALPLTLLPFVPLAWVPTTHPQLVIIGMMLLVVSLRLSLTPRAAWRLAAFVIFPALIYLVSYASTAQLSQWVDLFHRGESIGPASDYLRGKVPFRDTLPLHGMLEDGVLDAWLMQLFGRSLAVAVTSSVIIGSLLSVSLWFLGLAVFESIPPAMLCVAMGAWTTVENTRTFFQVVAAALLWNALKRGSRASAILSGVFAAIALFFSYEIGLYTIVAAIATIVIFKFLLPRGSCESVPKADEGAFFGAGLIAGAAPFLIYLTVQGALKAFFETSFLTIPRIIDAVWSLPFPDLVTTFRTDLNLHTLSDFVLYEKFHLILSPLTIGIAAAYLIDRWRKRRIDRFDAALLMLTIFAAVTQRTAFGRAEFRHQYFAAFLVGPMIVMLAILFARKLRDTARDGGTIFVITVVLILVPVTAILFWIPDLVNARIDDLLNYQRRVLHVIRDGHAEETAFRIDAVSQEIRALTRANDPIFDFSNQPAFYFFANRPNPTRFYQVPILSPGAFQAETLAVLERTKPRVIIRTAPDGFDRFDGVANDLRAQAVSAYIDDCYRFYKSVRGVELWTRLAVAKPRPLQQYLRRIHLPAESEIADTARGRVVFPFVGTSPGIGDARWVSDLTLHNPFRERISISLRYIAGGGKAYDRRVTLAPRQTIRWPDLAHTLFAVPGDSIGSLWIDHRVGRAPVASVRTFDAAHDAHTSIQRPLGTADAATAGSDVAELTIVGVPEAKTPRRVNVGVVNIGNIPATFRITVRGKSVESGVPETEVFMVSDIEHALGVTLDERETIRIRPIAGSGVAFASVIDASGDAQTIAAVPAQQP